MAFTQRGLKLYHSWVFGLTPEPTNFYVALVTDATEPDWSTVDFGDLTEIAAGNGYTSGGISLDRNATDFDADVLSTDPDYVDQQIKDLVFSASGGDIPSSGDGASFAVLTTDPATIANRKVIAYWPLQGAPVTILSGQSLTIVDAFLRLGGDLADTPTQYEESGQISLTAGNGAKGSYVEAIASTSFRSNRLIFTWESSSTDPLVFDLATGAAASEVVLIPDLRQVGFAGDDETRYFVPFDIDIAAGTRIAVRVQANGGTPTVECQVIIGGP